MAELTLPTIPHDGHVVLIGGGEFSRGQTREVDEYILGLVSGAPRIAFLPTASGSSEYARHYGSYLSSIRPDVRVFNVPVYRDRDARRGKNASRLADADVVYLGGGVVNHVVDSLGGSPVEEAMRQLVQRGGVVAAIGGASAAFGSLARSMLTHGAPIEGLGWLPEAMVEPLYSGEPTRTLQELLVKKRVRIGLGIPVGTAVSIGRDGRSQVVGEGDVAVLRGS